MISTWRRRKAERRAGKKQEAEENGSRMELMVPNHFRCPISLDLMKDPVTLSTGITYDRESIEKWLDSGNQTCPITNQTLRSLEPIPNHTIRRMIQEWCVENRDYGVERIPTPRIPVSSYEVSEILARIEVAKEREDEGGCRDLVAKIKRLTKESERNKRCLMSNGADKVLSDAFEAFAKVSFERNAAVLEEILSALAMFLPLDGISKSFLGSSTSLHRVVWFLRNGDLSSRRNAVLVVKEILSIDQNRGNDLAKIEGALEGLFELIKTPICPTATKASLLSIHRMVSSPNKVAPRLVEMGIVEKVIEMLVDCDRSICEKALGVLDGLCSYTEGRREACNNSLIVPVLVKKLLRISDLATEFSVAILWKLGKNEVRKESGGVLVEALQVGAFQKLLLLLQVGCSEKTREKATELLKLMNLYRDRAECIDSLDFKNLKRPF